jgi:diguanylate cyclase (GGDEF)-like protein
MLLSAGYEASEELFNNESTIIYRGIRVYDKKNVIIKTLNKNFPSSREISRVKREYELASFLLDIDGVRQVYQLLENNNSLMLVSEDIGGQTLKKTFFEAPLSPDEINIEDSLVIAIKIAKALSYIHQHGIIHKDISPDNIVFNPKTEQVKIIDFGISSLYSIEHQSFQNHNELEGKLEYMSPEQTGRINRTLDYRSDLYSLGVTLYQLFTGELPFKECDGIELVHAHMAKIPTSPHEINSRLPLSLAKIINRLLSKMADDRYQTAKGLTHDLELSLQQLKRKAASDFTLGELDISPKLQLKQKLYGREKEVALLINSFDRISQGTSEIMLISGLSGVGKSALVNEIHRPLTEKKGVFISGKFEQNQRGIPFYAWRQAFTSLAKYILKENDVSLKHWRELILNAIGNNGQVLVDAIPSFELILGEQPKTPVSSGVQAQHRLSYVINQFIDAIALKEQPLVIFIDDWQWADAASLELLKSLVEGKVKKHLLLIAAYRENEISNAHPFSLALSSISNSAVKHECIHLNNLTEESTQKLISDALQEPEKVKDLSKLLYEKTQGNAFFLVQFLEMLEKKSFLQFDLQQSHWKWDIQELNKLNITNNVVDLMVDKIMQLPEQSQQVLKFAACLGNSFQLIELAKILDYSLEQTSKLINLPVKEGILRQSKNSYHFIHDHVHQAAYSIFDKKIKKQIHYKIAWTLLKKLSCEEQKEHLFDLVRHLNIGSSLINKNEEKSLLSSLNFQAGQRAKHVTAYDAALTHFTYAIDALSTDCWHEEYHQKTILLYSEAAEVAYFLSLFEQMETWLDIVLNNAKTSLEKAQAFAIKLQAYTAQNRLSDAVDASLHALKILDIEIPKRPNDFQVLFNLLKTKKVLKGHSPHELLSLTKMNNPQQLLAMDILGLTVPAAYWTSPNLVAMIIFKMTQNSVEQGYAPISGYAFSWWGITECAMLGNIDNGYDYGELGIKLAETHNLYLQQPLFFSGWMVNNYKHPLKESLPILDKAYAISLEKGDFEYASYALNNSIQHRLHSGEFLSTLLPSMEETHQTLTTFKMASSQFWHDICWQLASNLSQLDVAPKLLSGKAYDEAKQIEQHLKENDASTLFFLYFAKLMQSYLLDDTPQALVNANKIKPFLKAGVGTFQHRLFYFYDSLALLSVKKASFFGKWRHRKQILSNQKKLKKWAEFSPHNHLHHWHLVQAEYMRLIDKPSQAMKHYNLAINLANDKGFIHEEALAYELFTRFHIENNQTRFAASDLIQSHYLYKQWGAHGKAKQLQQQYAHSFPQILTYTNNNSESKTRTNGMYTQTSHLAQSSSHFLSSQLDLETIIKSSQLIAGEIVFSELIKTLSSFIIENAGAQRFLLLKVNEGNTSIEFESLLDNEKVVSNSPDSNEPNKSSLTFPSTLIAYVKRTQYNIALDNALKDESFCHDEYFIANNIKSVFCGPLLHQGQLTGIIYLENRLISGVFTPDRIELIQLLSSQAAISIENSKLYCNLENKVLERTQQLEAVNEQLTLLATTDNLTKLSNRRQFNERIKLELDRAKRQQSPTSLLLCDIDNFKKFNDCYGHVDGDKCLEKVGMVFNNLFTRASDLSARYGGEEFAVILSSTDHETAVVMANKLCKAIQALNIPHQDNGPYANVTISIGCHSITPNLIDDIDSQIELLLRQTDKALYQAKEQGRNCVIGNPVNGYF